MKKILLFAAAALIISACSNNENKNSIKTGTTKTEKSISFSNDMENAAALIPSWANEAVVNEGLAHSGKYSCMMDETRENSYAFLEILGNINKKMPTRIVVTAWIYSTIPDPDASFVLNITDGDKSVLWNSGTLVSRIPKANEWTEVTCYFAVDKPVFPSNQVRVYIWNLNKLKFYIDDMNITFEY